LYTKIIKIGLFLTALFRKRWRIFFATQYVHGGPRKWGHRLTTIILSSQPIFLKLTGRFHGKFVVKWILKIPPQLAYVATLPCETLMSAQQNKPLTINYKLV